MAIGGSENHQLYVLGFAFTGDGRVALIRKNKPEWQAGYLNGIGGKVEGQENSSMAMVREFHEETGVLIPEDKWQFRGRMYGPNWSVFVFTSTDASVKTVRSMESEQIILVDLDDTDVLSEQTIENVQALIQLCRIPTASPGGVYPRFELNYRWSNETFY